MIKYHGRNVDATCTADLHDCETIVIVLNDKDKSVTSRQYDLPVVGNHTCVRIHPKQLDGIIEALVDLQQKIANDEEFDNEPVEQLLNEILGENDDLLVEALKTFDDGKVM
jgi:hypothetical protein